MKLITGYLLDSNTERDFSKLNPLEKSLSEKIYPKIDSFNEGILDEGMFNSLCNVLIFETARTTNIDKNIVRHTLNKILDEVIDARYTDKDISALSAQHQKYISGPKKSLYSVMHHDGKSWQVTPHSNIESAAKDYIKKSALATKTGHKVKIIDSNGSEIHSSK